MLASRGLSRLLLLNRGLTSMAVIPSLGSTSSGFNGHSDVSKSSSIPMHASWKRDEQQSPLHASFASGSIIALGPQQDDKDTPRQPDYTGSAKPTNVPPPASSSEQSPPSGGEPPEYKQGLSFSTGGATHQVNPATGGGSNTGVKTDRVDHSGSGSYMLLALAHSGLAATALLAPEALANFFVPGVALPQGMQTQVLAQLLGSCVALGAVSCYALKKAGEEKGGYKDETAQRLQLGLIGLSTGAIGLHLLYSPVITFTSVAAGAAVMGATFVIPYSTYKAANPGQLGVGNVVSRYFGAVPDHFNVNGVYSGLYAVLTPVVALAGASYLFMPEASMAMAFGYVKDKGSLFLWQNIGGALMTLAPAVTYSLKRKADLGQLGDPVSHILNAGLLSSALGHLSVLLPMVQAGQGGPLLGWLLGAWSAAAVTSAMGLFAKRAV